MRESYLFLLPEPDPKNPIVPVCIFPATDLQSAYREFREKHPGLNPGVQFYCCMG